MNAGVIGKRQEEEPRNLYIPQKETSVPQALEVVIPPCFWILPSVFPEVYR
jgi:hypothetical protein